jgi:glycosyltransferase involved in cell wall biosynthesis
VYPSSAQYTGGVVALYEFANALARRGAEVHFIHGPASPWRVDHLDELDWFRFEPGMGHHLTDSLDDPALPAADVVFSPAVPARLGLPAVFIQGHGMMDPAWERDAFRARCPKVCIAKWLVDVGLDYGVPGEQLLHVPHGMDHDLFRTVTPLHERPVDVAVLYNKHPAKGWEVAVAALELLRQRRPDLRVQVFGVVPPERPIPDWLPFEQGLDREHLVTGIANQARVFLQPSWFEGFGFSAVEAMACGCALVTTDNGGSQDYAVHGETALVAPPGDAAALAAHVDSLLDDDDRRATMAAAGARHVRRFTWDHAGEALHDHMQRYVDDPQRYQAAPSPLVGTGGADAG